MSVLLKIADRVKARLEQRRAQRSMAEIERLARAARKPHDFIKAFARPGYHVIAEVKFASPSEDDIAAGLTPTGVAKEYLAQGATALSVLTEEDFFKGHLDFLRRIRAQHPEALLLRKDFIVDDYQIFEAVEAGADAILLIVALLGADETRRLMSLAGSLGLASLVEVHNAGEMRIALDAGARLIGVNNRDLKSLKVSLDASRQLASLAGPEVTLIAESGLSRGSDLRELGALGYKGFLIGTHFMRTGHPGEALAKLLREAV